VKEQARLHEENHQRLQVKEQARLHIEGMQRQPVRRNGPPKLTAKQAQEILHAHYQAIEEKKRFKTELVARHSYFPRIVSSIH